MNLDLAKCSLITECFVRYSFDLKNPHGHPPYLVFVSYSYLMMP